MIKVKEFNTNKYFDVDDQINGFIEEYTKERIMKIIDIKYSTLLDTKNDIIMSFALLIYEDLGETLKVKEYLKRDDIKKDWRWVNAILVVCF